MRASDTLAEQTQFSLPITTLGEREAANIKRNENDWTLRCSPAQAVRMSTAFQRNPATCSCLISDSDREPFLTDMTLACLCLSTDFSWRCVQHRNHETKLQVYYFRLK